MQKLLPVFLILIAFFLLSGCSSSSDGPSANTEKAPTAPVSITDPNSPALPAVGASPVAPSNPAFLSLSFPAASRDASSLALAKTYANYYELHIRPAGIAADIYTGNSGNSNAFTRIPLAPASYDIILLAAYIGPNTDYPFLLASGYEAAFEVLPEMENVVPVALCSMETAITVPTRVARNKAFTASYRFNSNNPFVTFAGNISAVVNSLPPYAFNGFVWNGYSYTAPGGILTVLFDFTAPSAAGEGEVQFYYTVENFGAVYLVADAYHPLFGSRGRTGITFY